MELYIHIPFCVRKCYYCDFLSFEYNKKTVNEYIKSLIGEIEISTLQYGDLPVTSVFIGGGTPSVLTAECIEKIMIALKASFNILPDAEITIEANPGTVTPDRLVCWRFNGINRLSMGLQGTHINELSLLGRIHDYDTFVENYELARKAGFDNINVDLMSAIPGQSLKDWEENLDLVTGLEPEHISAYSLIIEEGTLFFEEYSEGKPLHNNLVPEELEREMYYLTRDKLAQKGYSQYELSNYAKDGYECRHNIGYWTRDNYLGLGLGAASLIDDCRFSNTDKMSEYLLGIGPSSVERLSKRDAMGEFMFLGLRMTKGVNVKRFESLYGCSCMEVYGDHIDKMSGYGLLEYTGDYLRLTNKGMDLANTVMCGFV